MPKEVLSQDVMEVVIDDLRITVEGLREQVNFLERREEILLRCVNIYSNEEKWSWDEEGKFWGGVGPMNAKQALEELKNLKEEN
jgi:hypothetical protein